MPDPAHWGLFLAATVVLLLIPGPSVLYAISRSIDHGPGAALPSALGLAAGDLVQVVCAAAGLSVVLASSEALFTVIKYAGAAYLVYLGIRRLLDRRGLALPEHGAAGSQAPRALFVQGLCVNALNPKTTLFFLSLLPQFVDPAAGPAWVQILLLGIGFVGLSLTTNFLYGRLGGAVGALARRSRRFQTATRYVSAGTLVALGAGAALAQPPRHALASTR